MDSRHRGTVSRAIRAAPGARAPIPIYVYLQVSVTPWCGRGYVPFSPVPFRVPVLSVLGEVFEVPHKAEPTPAEVDGWIDRIDRMDGWMDG